MDELHRSDFQDLVLPYPFIRLTKDRLTLIAHIPSSTTMPTVGSSAACEWAKDP